ncbi:hypothetical protein CSOJ01_01018 [Colletotrichum sojae]|uniref:Uncharacterized protein n=1 Tax=Colletotrichum sojae TaxID=2175907 RepID=A0A8H6N588_9PEZI|nr:hypothetical protein CSOJ01_01018 [Colletotrichum sojae]
MNLDGGHFRLPFGRLITYLAALGAALAIPSPRYGYACLAQAAARPGDPPGSFQFADRRLQNTSASWHRLAEERGIDVRDGHSKTGGLVKSAIEYALVSPPDGVELIANHPPAAYESPDEEPFPSLSQLGANCTEPQPLPYAYGMSTPPDRHRNARPSDAEHPQPRTSQQDEI